MPLLQGKKVYFCRFSKISDNTFLTASSKIVYLLFKLKKKHYATYTTFRRVR